jgi:hypothetical protein
MSLSIPMIRNPSAAKRRALSDPISPAEPVTIILRIDGMKTGSYP